MVTQIAMFAMRQEVIYFAISVAELRDIRPQFDALVKRFFGDEGEGFLFGVDAAF